ncbi:hypothetical protein Tco_0364004 [Tanacetum coccineum]
MLVASLILLKTSFSSPTLKVIFLLKTSIFEWAVDKNGHPRIEGTLSSSASRIFTSCASLQSSQPKFCSRLGKGTVSEKLLCYVPNTTYGPRLIRRISEKSALAVEINLTWSRSNSLNLSHAQKRLSSGSCWKLLISSIFFAMTDTPYSISVDTLYRSVECQYAALNSQNCLEEQIRCLDYKTRYAVLSRKLDTWYPTGGYGVSVSEIRLDTPYGDKWIRRIGVNFHGVRDKIKSVKIITINHIKCVSFTDEQLCIGRIVCSGYARSGIDHYAFLVLSWR